VTRPPGALRRKEQRLNLRHRVVIAFGLAAVFLIVTNVFLASLLIGDVTSNVDRTVQGTAIALLDQSSTVSSATLARQVGVLSLNDVVEITVSASKRPNVIQGPVDGLLALSSSTSSPITGFFSAKGWEFYRITSGSRVVVVGSSLASWSKTRQSIIIEIVILAVTSLVIIAILSIWMVSIAIDPLASIAAVARSIANGARGTRVNLEEYLQNTEVGDVAHAFNEVMVAQEDHIAKEETLNADLHALNQELRQFVADAGHELRTPLTSIQGYAQLLGNGTAPTDASQLAVTRIVAESARMSRLIEDLLKLARMEARTGMRYEHIDLVDLVKDQIADHESLTPTHPVTLVSEADLFLDADYDQLAAMVANLLVNLRTHTPEGTSATFTLTSASDMAHLEYSDTGPGLAHPESLFKRFWRSPGTSAPGTGLGMAIVYGTVRAHRGTIIANSTPGHGLRISISLPLVASMTSSDPEQGSSDDTVPSSDTISGDEVSAG
jgi:two-component system OmpR family sensor kinase